MSRTSGDGCSVAPRASLIAQSDTIVVKVGAEQKKYTLHKKLLAYHSGYFQGALSGKFKETDDGTIHLDNVNTDTFDVFVDWTYEKQLPACCHAPRPKDSPDMSIRCRTYVLADRLLVPRLKNALTELLLNAFSSDVSVPALEMVIYFFEHLPESDPVPRFLVDVFCPHGGVTSLHTGATMLVPQLPQPFLVRVLLRLNEITRMGENEKRLKREDYWVKE